MRKRILKSTFLVSMVTLLIAYVIIVGIMYKELNNRVIEQMRSEANYIANGIDLMGETYLQNVYEEQYTDNKVDNSIIYENRITWIHEDGTVLYDSSVEKDALENHIGREEIEEAIARGEGYSVRYSNTLDEQTVYYAMKLEDNSILRISNAYSSIMALLLSMLQPTILLVVVIIIISNLMSKRAAKLIVAPINDMNLNRGEMKEEYEELVPLLKRIRNQNVLIENQMEDLKMQQAKFKTLTEHMSEGLLVLDNKQRILSYNMAAVRLIGASDNLDYTGKDIATFDRNRNVREAVEKALNGEHCESIQEIGERLYQMIANPILVESKEKTASTTRRTVDGVVILILDETEKEKREQLRREFTSNVSHELKTPLTSISGIAEIIMNGIVKQEDIPGFAKNIYEEAGRLVGLVNDIIFLSKLDEGTLVYQQESISVLELVEQVRTRLIIPCNEKKISMQIEGEEVEILGIPSMIEEVIYNLCDNAIKYNKEGGTVIVTVNQILENSIPKVSIIVKDTGIGIPNEDIERIFERFYRVDKSHSKAIGGTGLGLSIVKHVVMFHNGSINTKSVLGEGTSIEIVLPMKLEEVND